MAFRIRTIRRLLLIAYLGLLGYLLLTPAPIHPGGSDLVGHAAAFALLGMLVWWNVPAGPWRELVALAVTGTIGAATELGQGHVVQRMPSVIDAAANLLGAGAGVAAVALLPIRDGIRLLAPAAATGPALVEG